jgi:hypothetical protein
MDLCSHFLAVVLVTTTLSIALAVVVIASLWFARWSMQWEERLDETNDKSTASQRQRKTLLKFRKEHVRMVKRYISRDPGVTLLHRNAIEQIDNDLLKLK